MSLELLSRDIPRPAFMDRPIAVGDRFRTGQGEIVTVHRVDDERRTFPIRTDLGGYTLRGTYYDHTTSSSDFMELLP